MDKVSWFELPADDAKRAQTFYSTVFGWQTGPMGDTGSFYAVTTPSEGDELTPKEPGAINGDISPRSGGFDKPLIVIETPDIDARIAAVQANGGKLVLPRRDHTDMGLAWAIVADTEGNHVGIIQNL